MEFDEFLGDIDGFSSSFAERIRKTMEKIEKATRNGDLKGEWQIKQIDKPNMKGYLIEGHFASDQPRVPFDPFNPLEPWDPVKRRPIPKRPFDLQENSFQQRREPLTDIFEEEDAVKIYAEVPGEDKDDIQLNLTEGKIEVKGENFYKTIDLPTRNIDMERASSTYKNGVLQVTIPKKDTTVGKNERKIEIE